jgi:hypothetical protein
MTFIGWLLLGFGTLLVWAAVRGHDPRTVMTEVFKGQAPSK